VDLTVANGELIASFTELLTYRKICPSGTNGVRKTPKKQWSFSFCLVRSPTQPATSKRLAGPNDYHKWRDI